MNAARQRRDEVSLAVRRIVVRESRLPMDPAALTEDEPLNGELLRINSLGFLGMLVRLEDELDVVLPDTLFVKQTFTTVADLVDVVAGAVDGTVAGTVPARDGVAP